MARIPMNGMTLAEPRATHAAAGPTLHRSTLLATLQLFTWLFFRPAHWCQYIQRLDPTLAPDFSLAQLTPQQLRSATIRRLLWLGHVAAPALNSTLLIFLLLALHVPIRLIAIRTMACFVMSVGGSIIFGTGSASAVGMASGMLGGIAGAVAFALGVVRTGQVQFPGEATVARMMQEYLRGAAGGRVALIVAFGVAGAGMFVAVGGVGSSISERRARLSRHPTAGGALLGLLCGTLFFLAATLSANLLPFPLAISFGGLLAGLISARWMTGQWGRSVLFGLACALNNHMLVNVISPWAGDIIVLGIMMGIILGAWFALPYMLAEAVAGSWSGAIAGSLGFAGGWLLTMSAASKQAMQLGPHLLPGLLSLEAAVLLGLTERYWRPLLLFPIEEAWNLLLLRLDQSRLESRLPHDRSQAAELPLWLRFHSVFWDQHQRFRLYGLDAHLVLAIETSPLSGKRALAEVAQGHQRWAATAAQIELDARLLGGCSDLAAVVQAHRLVVGSTTIDEDLGGPASALLRRFCAISQDVEAALSQSSAHNQRLGLTAVTQRLESLVSDLDRSTDQYAPRFRPIAASWHRLVQSHSQGVATAVEQRQEIENPYVIGVPLSLAQELFVGRTDISGRIEQLLLDRRGPPLMLYGQRRMGKTSLLNNLGRLLPSTIVPLFVDLQGPASSSSDHIGLLYNLARSMLDSARKQRGLALPPLSREALATDPFTSFDEWLDRVEEALGTRTALLTLDEFEALTSALSRGRFDPVAVLGMLRHIVQHRQRIKVMLASSHTLEELAAWASYFINVQVIQVGYLNPTEVRKLIEQPTPDFALRYEPAASQRILDLTRGHPFLVQLLCAEVVSLKNEQDVAQRRLARLQDVEDSIPAALQHGSFFFADMERNQVTALGRRLLRALAAEREGGHLSRAALLSACGEAAGEQELLDLLRRDLIEKVEGEYRFEVELIRRWFAALSDQPEASQD